MSASESTSSGTNLQESIEQLIAETVRRSQVEHENEKKQLQEALQQALTEVEAGQAAMNKAAGILRSALDTPMPVAEETGSAEAEVPVLPVAIDEPDEEPEPATQVEVPPVDEPEVGPHELDVVAHDVTIDTAKRLQAMLRDREEVKDMKPRSFVNGELHLRLEMTSGLEMASIKEWIAEHKGQVATSTSSVLELRFGR